MNDMTINSADEPKSESLTNRFRHFFKGKGKTGRKNNDSNKYGQTIGFIWQIRQNNPDLEPMAFIVRIERTENVAVMSIYDSNETCSTSLSNCIEHVATGVYLEHLSDDYLPHQIKFIHRDTTMAVTEPQWGSKPVTMTWSEERQQFEDPVWHGFKADREISAIEKSFVSSLRTAAACGAEKWMRDRDQDHISTKRELELYDRFQAHISDQSEHFRFSLRGERIYRPS